MAHKNAVSKQQDSSQSPPTPLAAAATAFNLAVERCVRDAEPDAVHRVRTGSRRVQAMVDAMMRENPRLVEPGKSWLRPLKRIRRSAGEVRDLDVHRKLLQQWLGKDSPLGGADADSPLAKQAERLDRWLQDTRKHLAHGMQKQIRKPLHRLADAEAAFLEATGQQSTTLAPHATDGLALADFMRAVDSMPRLDAENLHEFRKAIKKARYVAESVAEGQASSSIAKALRRVQDAIGEWHDWQCLKEEADTALEEDATELKAFLEQEESKHFTLAMRTTQTMRARLTGEWMAMQQTPPKRPPSSVTVDDRHAASSL
jgi:CHAD domain-containing protein